MSRLLALFAAFSLLQPSLPIRADEPKADGPKPPKGWKEYTPKDNAFTIWIPEKTSRQSERERNSTIRGQKLKLHALRIEVPGSTTYLVEKLTLPAAMVKGVKQPELEEAFKDMVVSELKGKVADDKDVKLGSISGKEYLLDTAKGQAKVRLFVTRSGRVYLLYVTGSKVQIEKEDTATFLESCRLPVAKVNPDDAKTNTVDAKMESGKKSIPMTEIPATAKPTKIMGGGSDEFKEAGPEGALLVGFEFGLDEFFGNDVIRAVRPIYLLKKDEMVGAARGSPPKKVVKVLAKPGYAVGALKIKSGAGLDGLTVSFMKIAGDKLDPKDSYDSEWVGGKGGCGPEKIGGDGTMAVGIVGKTNDKKELTGIGLLLAK